jgi:16S rRNA (guanine966-N2)-methyltransferase
MRIIGGKYRSLPLKTLKGGRLRPTSDQLRETLFDVLGPRIEGACFLDAYAGSGAVGLEALSRGAGEVVFIEHHRAAGDLIRKNLEALDIQSGFRLMRSKVLSAIEKLEAESAGFDFIFLDPPYEEIREYHHVLRQLARSRLITRSSTIIVEHSRHVRLEEEYGALRRFRLLRHGDAQLAFYQLGI